MPYNALNAAPEDLAALNTTPDDVSTVKAPMKKPTGASRARQEIRKRAALNKTPDELAAERAKNAEGVKSRRKLIRDSQTAGDLDA